MRYRNVRIIYTNIFNSLNIPYTSVYEGLLSVPLTGQNVSNNSFIPLMPAGTTTMVRLSENGMHVLKEPKSNYENSTTLELNVLWAFIKMITVSKAQGK